MTTVENEGTADRPTRLNVLRRVIPIAQIRSVGLITVTLLSLEAFGDWCRIRTIIEISADHPFLAAERRRSERWERRVKEAFEHGEDIRKVTEGEREGRIGRPNFWFEVFDDRGVRYQTRPAGSSSHGGAVWECSFDFRPAIDPVAQTLHVVMDAVRWSEVELATGDELDQRLDIGPWQFAVPVGRDAGQTVTEL
jgi:hypothetical protein